MTEQVELENNCDVASSHCDNEEVNELPLLQSEALPRNNFKNTLRKAGRTLLVKTVSDFDEKLFKSIEGVQSVFKNKLGDSMFLVFDNVKNAAKGMKDVRQKYGTSHNLRVKFSYYKLFFKLNGLSNDDDYNTVKKGLLDMVGDNASVLYCKLYCKDKKYLGCGDMTVDTLEGLNNLLSQEKGLKEFTFDKYSGVFYKFNNKNN